MAAVQLTSLEEWKKRVGYHSRSLIESVNFSFKAIFSENLQSLIVRNNEREVAIKVGIYNRFAAFTDTI